MPIYEYECSKCGIFEYSQSISDDPLRRCPKCRRSVTKLLSASAFHLKGGGWYSDGYEKAGASESDTKPAADPAVPAKKSGKSKAKAKSSAKSSSTAES
jgi:putative FmdB family regulatory protein